MWAHIQDEKVLEQCVGVPAEWWTLIHREAVVGEMMTSMLPPEPVGLPAGGVLLCDRGPGGGGGGELWGHHECRGYVFIGS
jgi:hypothetical protein